MRFRVPGAAQDSGDRVQSDDRVETEDAAVPCRVVGEAFAEAVQFLGLIGHDARRAPR